MSEIIISDVYKVEVIESERGWGSETDEVKYFKTEELAKWYVSVLNTVNKPKVGTAAIGVLFAVYHGEETI